MSLKVLILGASGKFGGIIADRLSKIPGVDPVLVGRSDAVVSMARDFRLAEHFDGEAWQANAHTSEFLETLRKHQVDCVVHTAGPFQNQSLEIARACVEHGCHYCDLADAREFVSKIKALDSQSQANAKFALGVGASTGVGLPRSGLAS